MGILRTKSLSKRGFLQFSILFLASSQSLLAADGSSEINQVCALSGGCFSGDTGGFPVTITVPGSYRLTSNLDLTGITDTTAIEVESTSSIQLGGFEIVGPVSCTGSGSTIECLPVDTGNGVRFAPGSEGSSIENGTIRSMGGIGIAVDVPGVRIRKITVLNNAVDGIGANFQTLIEDSVAVENGSDGIDTDSGSVVTNVVAVGNGRNGIEIDGPGGVAQSNSARGNGMRGYFLEGQASFISNISLDNGEPDLCNSGICSEQRRYYLTEDTFDGANALAACVPGFHMASMYEISSLTDMDYDKLLGVTNSDMETGPPTFRLPTVDFAWVRTGGKSRDVIFSSQVGSSNCLAWTSNSSEHSGAIAVPSAAADWGSIFNPNDVWSVSQSDCHRFRPVWCIED